jgi:thiol-disulfide isomerase/thioredoxin
MHSDRIDVLVITTPWCHHCRAMRPTLERLAVTYGESMRFHHIDASTEPERVDGLGVQGTPTIILQVDGVERSRLIGRVSDADLEAFLTTHGTHRPFPTDAAVRAGAGVALSLAGWVLATPVLVAIGVALAGWAAATMWRWSR